MPNLSTGSSARGPAAAHHRPDASDELTEPERLDHVVVGAELEADDPIELLAACRDHDDGDVGPIVEPSTHLHAVEIGKSEIEEHEIDGWRGDRLGTGRNPNHGEPLALQTASERYRDRVVVLHDEQLHARHSRVLHRGAGDPCPNLCLPLGFLGTRVPYRRQYADPTEDTMNRRKLLATTGAVSLTAAAAVVAIGANIGLFGLTDTGTDVGRFQPVTATSSTTAPPTVLYLDVQDPPAATPGVTGSAGEPGNEQADDDAAPTPSVSTPRPTSADPDHEDDDDGYHETSDDFEHESESEESEHDDD